MWPGAFIVRYLLIAGALIGVGIVGLLVLIYWLAIHISVSWV